jgi:hypothetical protein
MKSDFKKEQIKYKICRWKELLKIGLEINEVENKTKLYIESMRQVFCSMKRLIRLINWKIEEIDKFLDTFHLSKFNQEDISHLN